ncbi:hypothetical protein ABZ545_21485 [Streptomyces abikoensis]
MRHALPAARRDQGQPVTTWHLNSDKPVYTRYADMTRTAVPGDRPTGAAA